MHISGPHDGAMVLRLTEVSPAAPKSPPAPKSAPRMADGDTVSFEAVYISSLPRVPMTEAHRRLELLRRELVAGRTEVPIHFRGPHIARTSSAWNDPAATALRFTPNPADVNATATERAAAGG
jgi:hypothetical protein